MINGISSMHSGACYVLSFDLQESGLLGKLYRSMPYSIISKQMFTGSKPNHSSFMPAVAHVAG